MSEVRLVVREAERDWTATVHGSHADRVIAALSADPITLEELEAAGARFVKPRAGHRFVYNISPGLRDEPHDAGLVVVDLIARLVVVDSTYSSPRSHGDVDYHNGECCTQTRLWYHLAEDWLFLSDANNWQHVAETRRQERAAKPLIDARKVFYGLPLVEFIARETFTAFGRRDEIAARARQERIEEARTRLAKKEGIPVDQVDPGRLTEAAITPHTWAGEEHYASLFYDALKQIHADWLMTPRADLGGASPRDVFFERHRHLSWDLQDRCRHWSSLDVCPPGLAESSHAFQYGGFGTHEMVKYYDLVRELLWSCWDSLTELAQSTNVNHRPVSLTVGDFLTTEVPRLEEVREAWLDEPDLECHGRTARSIILRERARLPEGMSGHEAMVDPDCPCCQMLADLPGPTFWHLDGCNMDDEFAFSISHRTLEEWEEEQRSYEERSKKFYAQRAEREQLGVADEYLRDGESAGVWSRSLTVGETADVPLGVRVFGVGCRLAELIVELRAEADHESTPVESQRHIDQLNRDFGNLRSLLLGTDPSLAEALLDPVRNHFAETLDAIATVRPDLARQCSSLTNELQNLAEQPPSKRDWESDDSELPF